MTTRLPLVLGADGLPQQLQSADTVSVGGTTTLSTTAFSATLPGGAVLKGGTLAITNGTGTLTFPVAFPTTCVSVTATYYSTTASTTSSFSVTVSAYSKTAFSIDASALGGTGTLGITAANGTVLWQAVGY